MAKKKELLNDEIDLDEDLDFLDDFSNIDEQIDSLSNPDLDTKKRNPVFNAFRGVIKGAKSKITDRSFQQQVIRDALPEQYGDVIDRFDDIKDSLLSLYNDAVKDVKPSIAKIVKYVDRVVPEERKKTKKILEKFKDALDTYETPNREVSKEESIVNEIRSIFDAQTQAELELRVQDKAEEAIKTKIEKDRYNSQFELLNNINVNINKLANYNEKINAAYQKKSLELQYRSYFLQADLLSNIKTYNEIFNKQNQAIIKNTALPEFVKIKSSERFIEVSRTKFFDTAHEALFGSGSSIRKGFDNLKRIVKDFTSNFKDALEDGLSMAESMRENAETMRDLGIETSTEEMAGSVAGGFAAERLAQRLASKLRSKFGGPNSKIGRLGYRLNRYVNNIPGFIRDLIESEKLQERYETFGFREELANSTKGLIKEVLGGFLEGGKDLNLDTGKGVFDLSQPGTGFDNISKKSLVTIIPGYLARILREIQVFRTGNENIELTLFDHNQDKFLTRSSSTLATKKHLVDTLNSDDYNKRLDQLVEFFTKDKNVSEEAKKALRKKLSLLSFEDRSYSKKTLTNERFYRDLDPNVANELKTLIEDKFNNDDLEAKENEFSNKVVKLRRSIKDVRGDIQALLNAGQTTQLLDIGIIKKKGNQYYIDYDKYKDLGLETVNFEDTTDSTGPGIISGNTRRRRRGRGNIGPTPTVDLTQIVNLLRQNLQNNQSLPQIADLLRQNLQNTQSLPQIADLLTQNLQNNQITDLLRQNLQNNNNLPPTIDCTCIKDNVSPSLNKLVDVNNEILEKITNIDTNIANLSNILDNKCKGDKIVELLENFLNSRQNTRGRSTNENKTNIIGKFSRKITNALQKLFRRRNNNEASSEDEAISEETDNNETDSFLSKLLRNIGKATLKGVGKVASSAIKIPFKLISGVGWVLKNVAGKAIKLPFKALSGVGSVLKSTAKLSLKPFNKLFKAISDSIKIGNKTDDSNAEVQGLNEKNKPIAKLFNKLLTLTGTIIGSTINTTKDVFTEYLPAGYKSFYKSIVKLKNLSLNLLDGPKDVYVRGSSSPKLLATLMRNGAYFDQLTGKVIKKISDIKGPVVNAAGEVVLSLEDISNGLFDSKGRELKSVSQKVFDFIKSQGIKGYEILSKSLTGAKNLITGLFKRKGKHSNLKGSIFASENSTSILLNINDTLLEIRNILLGKITGTVGNNVNFNQYPDPTQKYDDTILRLPYLTNTEEKFNDSDNDGDKDNNWKEMLDSIESNKAKRRKKPKSKIDKRLRYKGKRNIIDTVASGAGGVIDSFSNDRDSDTSKEEHDTSEPLTNKKSNSITKILTSIKDILSQKLEPNNFIKNIGRYKDTPFDTDGNGLRQGHWKEMLDNLARKKAQRKSNLEENEPDTTPKYKSDKNIFDVLLDKLSNLSGGGILGGLLGSDIFSRSGGRFGGRIGRIFSRIGNLGSSIANSSIFRGLGNTAVGRLGTGLFARLGLTAGTGLLGGLASEGMLASSLGLLAGAGTALTSIATSPITIAALALAGTTYALYRGYNYLTRNKVTPIDKIRIVQYGFIPEESKDLEPLFKLEEYLQSNCISFKGNAPFIDESKFDSRVVLEIFNVRGIDHQKRFLNWFANRFKPVFLNSLAALKLVADKDKLSDLSTLDKDLQLKYIDIVKSIDVNYDNLVSPLADKDTLEANSALVEKTIAEVTDEIKNKKSFLEKTKEKAGNIAKAASESATAAWNKAVDLTNDAKKTLDTGVSFIKESVSEKTQAIKNKANELLKDSGVASTLEKLDKKIKPVSDAVSSIAYDINKKIQIAATSAIYARDMADKVITDIFNYFKSKLLMLRMAQYGLSPRESDNYDKIEELENYIIKNKIIKLQNNKPIIDQNSNLSTALCEIFKAIKKHFFTADEIDQIHSARIVVWYRNRFLPVFLTHITALKEIKPNKKLEDLLKDVDDLNDNEKVKYIKAIEIPDTVYTITISPFEDEKPLTATKETYEAIKASILKEVKNADILSLNIKSETLNALKREKSINNLSTSDTNAKDTDQIFKLTIDRKETNENISKLINLLNQQSPSNIATNRLKLNFSVELTNNKNNKVSALEAVRMKAYGLVNTEKDKVNILRTLEDYLSDKVTVNSAGVANFNASIEDLITKIGGNFGLSSINDEYASYWLKWFKNRFLPVYLTFIGYGYLLTNKKDPYKIELSLKDYYKYDLAIKLLAIPGIWNITDSPWKNYSVNTDITSTDENIKFLKENSFREKLLEEVSLSKDKNLLKASFVDTRSSKLENSLLENTLNQSSSANIGAVGSIKQDTSASIGSTDNVNQSSSANIGAVGSISQNITTNTEEAENPSVSNAKSTVETNKDTNIDVTSKIPTAEGNLADPNLGDQYIVVKKDTTLNNMHPLVLNYFKAMAAEYGEKTGEKILVNEGFRTKAKQAALRRKYGSRAAPPGTSMHEFGLALDINTDILNKLEKLGLMRKYGFTRPVRNETWHIEPAGIQVDHRRARTDPDWATEKIAASLGRGGGGWGLVKTSLNAPARNVEYAKKLLDSQNSQIVKDESNKSDNGPTTPALDIKNQTSAESGGIAASNETNKASDAISLTGSNANTVSTDSQPNNLFIKTANKTEPTSIGTISDEVKSESDIKSNTILNQNTNKAKVGNISDIANKNISDIKLDTIKSGIKSGYKAVKNIASKGIEGIKEIIVKAAKMVGIDPNVMLAFAAVESDLNPKAKAGTSSGGGLFQFIDSTWRQMIKKYGPKYGLPINTSKYDPLANSLMAAEYAKSNAKYIGKSNPTVLDLYLAHFLGPGGAKKYMSLDGNDIPARYMQKQAIDNRKIFFDDSGRARTKNEVTAELVRRITSKIKRYGIDLPSNTQFITEGTGGKVENALIADDSGSNIASSFEKTYTDTGTNLASSTDSNLASSAGSNLASYDIGDSGLNKAYNFRKTYTDTGSNLASSFSSNNTTSSDVSDLATDFFTKLARGDDIGSLATSTFNKLASGDIKITKTDNVNTVFNKAGIETFNKLLSSNNAIDLSKTNTVGNIFNGLKSFGDNINKNLSNNLRSTSLDTAQSITSNPIIFGKTPVDQFTNVNTVSPVASLPSLDNRSLNNRIQSPIDTGSNMGAIGLESSLTNVDQTLTKSLDIQTQTLNVLKEILNIINTKLSELKPSEIPSTSPTIADKALEDKAKELNYNTNPTIKGSNGVYSSYVKSGAISLQRKLMI